MRSRSAEALDNSFIPLGWHSIVPSLRPDHPLRYFTPSPLSTLVPYAGALHRENPLTDAADDLLGALICGTLTRQRCAQRSDLIHLYLEQYRRYIADRTSSIDLHGLLKVAAVLTGKKSSAIRNQIVYAGNPLSSSSPIFAIEDAVPALIDDLLESINRFSSEADPFRLASITMFCTLNIHPFLDGNGRVARLLAVHAAGRAGSTSEGAVIAGLQWCNRGWFGNLAMQAREKDLQWYLRQCEAERLRFKESLYSTGISSAIEDVGVLGSSRKFLAGALKEAFFAGSIGVKALRRISGLKKADAEAILADVLRAHHSIQGDTDRVDLTLLGDRVLAALTH